MSFPPLLIFHNNDGILARSVDADRADAFDVGRTARARNDAGKFREWLRFGHNVDHGIEIVDDLRQLDNADIYVRYDFYDTVVNIILHLDEGAQVGDAVIGFRYAAFVIGSVFAEVIRVGLNACRLQGVGCAGFFQERRFDQSDILYILFLENLDKSCCYVGFLAK